MTISTPVVVSQGSTSTASTSYVTDSSTPPSNQLLVLFVMTTGNNPIIAQSPTSVSGNGLTWTLLGTERSSNDRVRMTTYTAYGIPTTGSLTFTYPDSFGTAYKLISIEGASGTIAQSAVASQGGNLGAASISLPGAPAATSISLGGMAYNATQLITLGAGQVRVGSDLTTSGPVGTLCVTWETPADDEWSCTTDNGSGKGIVFMEVAEAEPVPTGPKNMLANSGFENDFGGLTDSEGANWEGNPPDARSRVSDGTAFHGTYYGVLSNPDGRAAPNLQSEDQTYAACDEGEILTASMYVRHGGGSATWSARLDIQYFDVTDNPIEARVGTPTVLDGIWQRIATTGFAAPAGTVHAQVRIVMANAALGDILHVDAVQLERGSVATEYSDNSIAPTTQAFLVVGGIEVPVNVFYVQGGIEVAATIDLS